LSHLDATGTDQVRGEVRAIINNLRRITAELRPPGLDNLGLVSAIRSSVRRALSHTDLSQEIFFTLEGNDEQTLPEDIATVVYRVFAEAFNNALNHAEAKRVDVNLIIKPGEIRLGVHDDGRGFEVPVRLGNLLESRHFGLVGIRERVDLVQGTFNIVSNPGEGTSIEVRIPTISDSATYALERNP
jgi:signal transduction histidine kinase